MKNLWIFTAVLALITTPFAASAQVQELGKSGQASPTPATAELADVLAIPTPAPLGPADLLHEYEEAMASTAEGFNAEANQIAEAVQQKEISEDQGEYLCKEAYQLAMMQFQVLSGLHDMLEEEVSQTPAARPRPANPPPAEGLNGSGYHNDVHIDQGNEKTI